MQKKGVVHYFFLKGGGGGGLHKCIQTKPEIGELYMYKS